MLAIILSVVFAIIIIAFAITIAILVSKEQLDIKKDSGELLKYELENLTPNLQKDERGKLSCVAERAIQGLNPEQQIGMMGGLCVTAYLANLGTNNGYTIPPVCEKYIGSQQQLNNLLQNGAKDCGIEPGEMTVILNNLGNNPSGTNASPSEVPASSASGTNASLTSRPARVAAGSASDSNASGDKKSKFTYKHK